MNEGLSAQPMKGNGLGEETMEGEGSTAFGQQCNAAAVDGEDESQDRGGQMACNGMEESQEEPVLRGSQLPSIGTEVVEIRPLNHKENMAAEAGDPIASDSDVQHQPPGDWLEPLEDDDDNDEEHDNQMWKEKPLEAERQVNGKRQKKKALKTDSNGQSRRRRRGTDVEGDWFDWPALGEGWKRKEVFRRSGFSVGKTDTYYKGPDGERVRSKIEMAKYVAGSIDITMFDFKSGVFLNGRTIRGMKRRKGWKAIMSTTGSVAAQEGAGSVGASVAAQEGAGSVAAQEGAGSVAAQEDAGSVGASVAAQEGAGSVAAQEGAGSVAAQEDAGSGLNLTPEKAGRWDSPCTPPAVPAEPLNPTVQKVTPPRVVVSRKAVSPRIVAASQRSSTSPRSLSASPHSLKVASVNLGTPLRRGGSFLSLCLTDIARQRLSAPSTPSRDVPPRNLPSLSASLVSLSPGSSPDKNYAAMQGQGLINSPGPPAHRPLRPQSTPRDSKLPLNGVVRHLDSSESRPRTCMSCGSSIHDEEVVEAGSMSLCPSCRPTEEQTDSQNSTVFRKGGHRQRLLGKASGENKAQGIRERQLNVGRKRTDIWVHFTFDARKNKTRCKVCELTLMGKNTTNLKRHLLGFHPEIHAAKKTRATSMLIKKQKALRTNARCLAYMEAKKLKKQYAISPKSDPEDFLLDPYEAESPPGSPPGHSRRSRRACWKCDACLRMTDCGQCDFCKDKPKFGGSNKKRQKCRLRQCQSQAMLAQSKCRGWAVHRRKRAYRSRKKLRRPWEDFDTTEEDDNSDEESTGALAPSEEDEHMNDEGEESVSGPVSQTAPAASAPSFGPGYSRLDTERLYVGSYPLPVQVPGPPLLPHQLCFPGNGDFPAGTRDAEPLLPPPGPEVAFNPAALTPDTATESLGLVLGDDVRIVEVVDSVVPEVTPVITEIFSLAEGGPLDGDVDQELLRLLEALRQAVLPAHWVGVMVTGPRLQLLQCSKLSTMADTVLHIEPDFSYHITVQEVPLLLTHRLYEAHPPRLASTPEVTSLLLDLEAYSVCQGYPAFEKPHPGPVLHTRAAACELLVPRSEERCSKCDVSSLVL